MNAYKEVKVKYIAAAVIALLAFSACAVLFSSDDSKAAAAISFDDDQLEVKECECELTIGGETKNVTVFEYLGVIYKVTSDKESEEEAGVIGVTADTEAAIVVCSFVYGEEDEEVTYSVTNVLADFKDNVPTSAKALYLADSITEFEEDCFKDLPIFTNDLVVEDVEDMTVAELKTLTGYAGNIVYVSELTDECEFTFALGDVNDNVRKNYNEDFKDNDYTYTWSFVKGITYQVPECDPESEDEVGFENPYYDMTEWLDEDNDISVAVDGQLLAIGTDFYVDGEDSGLANEAVLTAQWEETPNDYDEIYMWITVVIIVILAIVGLSMFGYRTMLARKG